jgi:cephalosporin hydroxylase
MSLIDIVDNSKTDKNTVHSYLELYQKILIKKKDTAQNVLEIGIAEGGSIKMWSDFFINAVIHGLDIINIKNVWDKIKNNNRIVLYTSTDAYDETFFKTEFLNENKRFDVMIDDGPHTLISMLKFIRLYSKLMTDNGILIIEDVQSWDWIKILTNIVPFHLRKFIKVYDLRENKDRYDDIVFTIDKS